MITKRIFTLLLFCSILTSAYTQHDKYIGVSTGMMNSNTKLNFGCSNCEIRESKLTYYPISLFAEFEKSKYYSFVPTLHYSKIGSSIFEKNDSTTVNYRVNYLSIDLLNRFKVFSNRFDVYTMLGPQFKKTVGVFSYSSSVKTRINPKDIFLKGFDANLRTGIGLSKANKRYKIVVEFILDFYFLDIDTRKLFDTPIGNSRGIFVGLEYKINNKK